MVPGLILGTDTKLVGGEWRETWTKRDGDRLLVFYGTRGKEPIPSMAWETVVLNGPYDPKPPSYVCDMSCLPGRMGMRYAVTWDEEPSEVYQIVLLTPELQSAESKLQGRS